MRVIMALLLLGLAACAAPAGSDSGAASTSPTAVDIAPANNDLLIVLDRGDGTEPERYTLVCVGVPEGDHPDPAAACAHLEGLDDPFAPLPTDMACTEQYGGPETVADHRPLARPAGRRRVRPDRRLPHRPVGGPGPGAAAGRGGGARTENGATMAIVAPVGPLPARS